jgi:uncharacterized protein
VPVEGETYPIEGHEIDLEQLVRDTILLELPLAPTCSTTDAAGAEHCQPVGTPVGVTTGDAESGTDATDPRWAALSELEL